MTRVLVAVTVLVASLTGVRAQEQTCTNSGNIYQVGSVACIKACHEPQSRLARCERKSYGTTWIYLSDTCPSAMLLEALGMIGWSGMPEVSPMTPLPTKYLPQSTPLPTAFAQTGLGGLPKRYLITAGVEAGGLEN